jgi:hypothetical protein
VARTININGLTLCHKGDDIGVTIATIPDVCKTPSPGGPVPVPYPNISFAKDLAKGTKTVLVDGENMAANKGSEFSKSIGDEPGTVGGIKSGINKAEATWLSYSMDVFLENKNACRYTDKMMMNHGNTVCMGGFLTQWLAEAKKGKPDCKALLEEINEVLNGNKDAGTSAERGVKERYYDQIHGEHGPGTSVWDGHTTAFLLRAAYLASLLTAYATYCGGGPPPPKDAYEWAYKKAPTPEMWKGPMMRFVETVTVTAPAPSLAPAVLTAVGLTGLAVILFLFPFDGPLGEAAAGVAAIGAWGSLFGSKGGGASVATKGT